jgi:GNAT superfamily N-acetyltransferase
VKESDPFVVSRTIDVHLQDGTLVRVRPIVSEDRSKLEEGFKDLSPRSRFLRFLRSIDHLTSDELTYLTDVDYENHFAWVALDQGLGIGVARYARLDHDLAEAAVVVLDRYQRKGLGRILLRLVAETAQEHGIRRFRAWVAPGNAVVMRLVEEWQLERHLEDGAVVIDIPLPLPVSLADSSLYETLREAAAGRIEPFL